MSKYMAESIVKYTIIKEINLKGVMPCTKLYARKIWEECYWTTYANENFKSFDNFLIDYTAFAEILEKEYDKDIKFYWEYDEQGYWTKIYRVDYPENIIGYSYCKIEYFYKEKKVILSFKLQN